MAQKSKQGEALGLISNALSPCPDKPNCVCSSDKSDVNHYIDPLPLVHEDIANSLVILKEVIVEMNGTLQAESDDYLAATFTSAIFGFVDDLEIKIDSNQNLIHFRSASRMGHSDMGVNKKRVELLKQLYQQKLKEHY
ncbi:MAG: hypothetical protein COA83_09115 [Methylophaga sp.]|nr:MAG: hypothetical protein COA83_09115 [Methylophaga sp.]